MCFIVQYNIFHAHTNPILLSYNLFMQIIAPIHTILFYICTIVPVNIILFLFKTAAQLSIRLLHMYGATVQLLL